MPHIIPITDTEDPALDVYVRLTGNQLRCRLEPERGIFIAESPTVIEVAQNTGCRILSMLTDERLLTSGSVAHILERLPDDLPVYTATRDALSCLTGFELTRGSLAAIRRAPLPSLESLLKDARRIAVLEGITDSTNVGAIFRSAAALNMDAVLITPTCCDPLCRRALRVSMGTVLQVPWGQIGEAHTDWPRKGIEQLHALGFRCAAMALSDNSVSIDDPTLLGEERLALILGTEGTGLMRETIEACDYTVRIPMSHGVDSLNVAAAAAVAFWQVGKR